MHRIVLYFLLAGMLSLSACAEEKPSNLTKPNILSSIKPVHAIVVAIAGEHVNSDQLIPDFSSPHHYVFKPSDIRKVKRADIIFRIDEHFESILNPILTSASKQSKIVSLAENTKIHLLSLSGEHSHDGHTDENHNAADMHIFTSPKNAIVMAQTITESLSKLDPEHADDYKKNYQLFNERILTTSKEIQSYLAPLNDTPYIVFHNSWQYFADYFGLRKPNIISHQEGMTAGAKTLLNTRNEISSENIRCIFSDSTISAKQITALTKGLVIHNTRTDVLAEQLPINQNTYVDWLNNMGQKVKICLEK